MFKNFFKFKAILISCFLVIAFSYNVSADSYPPDFSELSARL